MTLDELRAIYDREQRINVEYTGVRREVLPNLIRMIDHFGDRLFEWNDRPGDLRDRLAVKGLTVDASPMSRPILEKFGFHLIAYSYPCQWRGA